jgi:four helix bundle protein
MPRDHRNLTAFSLADDLALKVYGLTTRFEPTEHYGLRLQIRRAAVSVPTNIVEGAARESQAEFLRFLEIAFGSSREVVYLADLSHRLGFLECAGAERLTTDGNRVAATLGALRRSLRNP